MKQHQNSMTPNLNITKYASPLHNGELQLHEKFAFVAQYPDIFHYHILPHLMLVFFNQLSPTDNMLFGIGEVYVLSWIFYSWLLSLFLPY